MNTFWSTLRIVVDVFGTVGVLFALYIVIGSAKDSWRYIKMSRM